MLVREPLSSIIKSAMTSEQLIINAKCRISCNSPPSPKFCSRERRVTSLWGKKRTKNKWGKWAVRVSNSPRRWSKVVDKKASNRKCSLKRVWRNKRRLSRKEYSGKGPTAVEDHVPKWLQLHSYVRVLTIKTKIWSNLSQRWLHLKRSPEWLEYY